MKLGVFQQSLRYIEYTCSNPCTYIADRSVPAISTRETFDGLQKHLSRGEPGPVAGGAVLMVGALNQLWSQRVQAVYCACVVFYGESGLAVFDIAHCNDSQQTRSR